MISSVKVLKEGLIFEVESVSATSDLKAKNIVDVGNNDISSWTCRRFRRDCLPCKHCFAVIDAGYRIFQQLSPLLLEHPLMTLDENLSSSQLNKPNLSPNLLYTEIHEYQDNVNSLDENSEVKVTDKTEYVSLFSRRSLFKHEKMVLIVNLKNLVESVEYQWTSQNANQYRNYLLGKWKWWVSWKTGNARQEQQSKENFKFKKMLFPRKRKHKYAGRMGSKAEIRWN